MHADWLVHYGYLGVFLALFLGILALPVPDETILTLTGVLSYEGTFHLGVASVVCLAGSICGVSASYWIGRTLGLGAVHRFGRFMHVSEAGLARTRSWFERWGKWAIPLAYFVPVVRHLAALVAGTSGMRFPVFAVHGALGALIWTQLFLHLGYRLGPEWESLIGHAHWRLGLVLAIAAAWLLALAALAWRRNCRREQGG